MQHRLATQADLPQIVAIYNSTVSSRMVTADTEPVEVSSRQAWFEAHQRKERPLWVIEKNGQVVAWLSFSDFYGRPAYAGTVELSIYVHEQHRGQGWGAYLLDQAINFAPSVDIQNLLGFIFAHNAASLTLFGTRGFSQWAHLPGVANLSGMLRDLLILGCKVGALHDG